MSERMWEKKIQEIKEVRLLGRIDPKREELRLHWAMSGIALQIKCSELYVELEAAYGDHAIWAAVLVDGTIVSRFPVMRGRHWYPALLGMDPEVDHEVSIVRDSQPIVGDGGMYLTLHALRAQGELLPVKSPAMTIEFIGDSLTCGEGCLGPVSAMEWRTVYISAANTYAQAVCRELGAQGRWISLGGWGTAMGYDGDRNSAIPRIYDQLCTPEQDGAVPYDFTQSPADLVIVNLGTNDGGGLSTMPKAQHAAARREIEQAAAAFIRQIRARNPGAYILWAYGMCKSPLGAVLRRAVETVRREGDLRVGYLPLPAGREQELGSRSHPGRAAHKRAAKAIVKYWRQLAAEQS